MNYKLFLIVLLLFTIGCKSNLPSKLYKGDISIYEIYPRDTTMTSFHVNSLNKPLNTWYNNTWQQKFDRNEIIMPFREKREEKLRTEKAKRSHWFRIIENKHIFGYNQIFDHVYVISERDKS